MPTRKKILKTLKHISYALVPLIILLLTLEVIVRFKYFFDHNGDTAYLFIPFSEKSSKGTSEGSFRIKTKAKSQPLIIEVPADCRDYENVEHYINERKINYTFNDDCLRGRKYEKEKKVNVFRIAMVGGSTVFGALVSDDETVPYYLEDLLNKNDHSLHYEIINAGFPGYNSGNFVDLIRNKLIHYDLDLILYYEAINDISLKMKWFNSWWVDEKIGGNNWGSFANSIHKKLHYRWMFYTYLVEKYHFMQHSKFLKEKFSPTSTEAHYRIRPDFENNIGSIIDFTQNNHIPIVFIKQVINYPRYIDDYDTFDEGQLRALFEANLEKCSNGDCDIEKMMAINQRYVLKLMERKCKVKDIRIIDFIEKYHQSVPQRYFIDVCHQTRNGNNELAKFIFREIKSQKIL